MSLARTLLYKVIFVSVLSIIIIIQPIIAAVNALLHAKIVKMVQSVLLVQIAFQDQIDS